jgi:DNA-binding PucR family transcriptional regulator
VEDPLDHRTLRLSEAGPAVQDLSVLLVPDAGGNARPALLGLLRGQAAVVGPARPWMQVKASYDRAVRTLQLPGQPSSRNVVDTEEHLAALVLTADPQTLADLRARMLEPLSATPDATAVKLAETLRSWLRHQGRREDVAAELFIHPQTVRYRMARLRELYGDRLRDPEWVSALTVALAMSSGRPPGLSR